MIHGHHRLHDRRHVKNERINRSASWQYIGAGDDQIT
ncbi:hypothetical protein QU863_27410, partial [Escherichia coli]|nr:hypothetical protein [Escherichia coli]